MEASVTVAPVTVTTAAPLTPVASFAPMVLVPAATPVTRPLELTVATLVLDEVHVASRVTSLVVPSLSVAVAAYCTVPFTAIEAPAGVTATEVTVAVATAVTVRDADPLTVPTAAEIVALPAATPVASPPALTVAVALAEEDHDALAVTMAVEPSL
jgi:hypothetical protein